MLNNWTPFELGCLLIGGSLAALFAMPFAIEVIAFGVEKVRRWWDRGKRNREVLRLIRHDERVRQMRRAA